MNVIVKSLMLNILITIIVNINIKRRVSIMNKRQKKKFEKKGELKKFTFNYDVKIADHNHVVNIVIRNGKLKQCGIMLNGDTIPFYLTKSQRKSVIAIARQMYRINARCVDLTPGFRGDPFDLCHFPPQPIRYYRHEYPSFCDYLNNKRRDYHE